MPTKMIGTSKLWNWTARKLLMYISTKTFQRLRGLTTEFVWGWKSCRDSTTASTRGQHQRCCRRLSLTGTRVSEWCYCVVGYRCPRALFISRGSTRFSPALCRVLFGLMKWVGWYKTMYCGRHSAGMTEKEEGFATICIATNPYLYWCRRDESNTRPSHYE